MNDDNSTQPQEVYKCECTNCGDYIELKVSEFVETDQSGEYVFGQKLKCPHCHQMATIRRTNDDKSAKSATTQKNSLLLGVIAKIIGIVLVCAGLVLLFSIGGGATTVVLDVMGASLISLGLREIGSKKAGSKIFGVVAIGLGLIFFSTNFLAGMGIYVLCIIGVVCYMRGKRYHAIATHDLLVRKDHRPPVVYLRSFKADEVTRRGTIFGDFQTEEEVLAEVLSEFGPVVAIGKPGEELPELGAARLYVRDAECL
jgi:hypothetical protein